MLFCISPTPQQKDLELFLYQLKSAYKDFRFSFLNFF